MSFVSHHAQQTNNSSNINFSGDGATRRVLNPDSTAAKTLQGIGWANINILRGNVIFFSKKAMREAEVQPITLAAPFHLLQGAPWIGIDGSLVLVPAPSILPHSAPSIPAQLPSLCPACARSDFTTGAAAGSGSRIQSVFVARERLDNDNLCVRAEPRQR